MDDEPEDELAEPDFGASLRAPRVCFTGAAQALGRNEVKKNVPMAAGYIRYRTTCNHLNSNVLYDK
jgi:hypothetical protein